MGLLGLATVPSHVPSPAAITNLTRFLAGINDGKLNVSLRLMSMEMPRMAGRSKIFQDDAD